jgi:hypothetical protein
LERKVRSGRMKSSREPMKPRRPFTGKLSAIKKGVGED